MLKLRMIARLDIKAENLIKGIHLEGLRVLGRPWDFANNYYQQGIDELLYMDAVASLYGRNSLTDIIKKNCPKYFYPPHSRGRNPLVGRRLGGIALWSG